MVRVILSIRKTLEEQATARFNAAKKAKRKREGTLATIERFERELPRAKEIMEAPVTKRQWYEAFRWSFTTDGILIIGGRDATTNESLIKKHVEPRDIVFHTELPGSPFIILKSSTLPVSSEISSLAVAQAGQFCAAYSRQWKNGLAVADVYWVHPEQLSKTPNSGESLGRGSFMVRGEKHFLRPEVQIALGMLEGAPTVGVPTLFQEKGVIYGTFAPGQEKVSDLAKKLAKRFGNSPDVWNPLLPAGGGKLLGWKKGMAPSQRKPNTASGPNPSESIPIKSLEEKEEV